MWAAKSICSIRRHDGTIRSQERPAAQDVLAPIAAIASRMVKIPDLTDEELESLFAQLKDWT